MTYSVDTLITNTQSVATSAANAVSAMRDPLARFAAATYPIDINMLSELSDWVKNDADREGSSSVLKTLGGSAGYGALFYAARNGLPKYDGLEFPDIPEGPGGTPEFDTTSFTTLISGLFPSVADAETLRDNVTAAMALVDSGKELAPVDVATKLLNARIRLRDEAATDIPAIFTTRGGPMPGDAAESIGSMVRTTHDIERAFIGTADLMRDETFNINTLSIQATYYADALIAFTRMKLSALSALFAYLDTYIAELRLPLDIATIQANAEIGTIQARLDEIKVKAEYNSGIMDRMNDYFSALTSYEGRASDFQIGLRKHSNFVRDLGVSFKKDVRTNIIGADTSMGTEAARRAAASVSALGSVISSAVTSFG